MCDGRGGAERQEARGGNEMKAPNLKKSTAQGNERIEDPTSKPIRRKKPKTREATPQKIAEGRKKETACAMGEGPTVGNGQVIGMGTNEVFGPRLGFGTRGPRLDVAH